MIVKRELFLNISNDILSRTITGDSIVAESLVLKRSICDSDFKLGGCIAAQFEIQLIDINPDNITGNKITAYMDEYSNTENYIHPGAGIIPSASIYPGKCKMSVERRYLFKGDIDSAVRQKNRHITKVTAYDALYNLGTKNVYTWFSQVAEYSPSITIRQLLDSYNSSYSGLAVNNLGTAITYNLDVNLSLSRMKVADIYAPVLYSSEVLRSICELLGVCGYIDQYGAAKIVKIRKENNALVINQYKDLTFEEYNTDIIHLAKFAYNKNDTYEYGTADAECCYFSNDNAVLKCCTGKETAEVIIQHLQSDGLLFTSNYQYRPFEVEVYGYVDPNDCFGREIKVATGFEDLPFVYSFAFTLETTGIHNMMTKIKADGKKTLTE